MLHFSHKILTLEQAFRRVHSWKLLEEKVVLTNGCFDILHLGHITYLEQARNLGKRLVVGLNSDASVKRLKGESRPIFSEMARASLLAALECVDAVVIFDADTATEILQTLEPEIWVKGGDYSPETLPEYDTVKAYGGEVVILPFVEGYSSTDAIKRADLCM